VGARQERSTLIWQATPLPDPTSGLGDGCGLCGKGIVVTVVRTMNTKCRKGNSRLRASGAGASGTG
jgi:hypothetical protein